ncbi:N-acetylmuramoyl-L-alanine amidase family protein [Robiginitalea sediminis]|uniref:N-acetylmuramoyl-L-alanine amidase family protein n=1 Tax=Robiginitalea sediminis TaxID=1982593 RepID=UPI000B4B2415|nr:N-acetylmuramoyl-L-alanine amidase [Robiginitalea sediminis]
MPRGLLRLFTAMILVQTFPVCAQDSLQQVVAAPGDGIYSLLRRHGADLSRMDDFRKLNGPRLGEGDQLIAGSTYVLPSPVPGDSLPETKTGPEATATETLYELFGPDYARVPERSKRLEGAVYYLISGHGGPDPGAVTRYGKGRISEDEYAYDITLRLAHYLISHGALVYVIIRDPDDGIRDQRILEMDRDEVTYPDLEIPLGQKERLEQRVEAVNKLYRQHRGRYQRLVVTHVDSRSKGQNIDVFFYHHEKSKSGRRLAEHIHATFRENYARFQPGRTYTGTFEDRSSLYVVKNTLPATAFIEVGNISNTRDQRRILEPDNRQALAKWIGEGLMLDFESRED